MRARVTIDGVELDVVNTHLGLGRNERLAQLAELTGPGWLAGNGAPVVVMGDLNSRPGSAEYRQLGARFADAQCSVPGWKARRTWPSLWPCVRIDHVFVGGGVEVKTVAVPAGLLERIASDHLPVVTTLRLPGNGDGPIFQAPGIT
jgi:endonuclease/exonuclease/phosphatase family metal-dependent hydrolase